MKKMYVASLMLLLACSGLAIAQAPVKPPERRTIQQVLDRAVKNTEQEFVSAADAMPEDKYSFAPTNGEFKGVRNFGEQVKHVAAVNYEVAAAMIGEKPRAGTIVSVGASQVALFPAPPVEGERTKPSS